MTWDIYHSPHGDLWTDYLGTIEAGPFEDDALELAADQFGVRQLDLIAQSDDEDDYADILEFAGEWQSTAELIEVDAAGRA